VLFLRDQSRVTRQSRDVDIDVFGRDILLNAITSSSSLLLYAE
jgi:hypothetical protein